MRKFWRRWFGKQARASWTVRINALFTAAAGFLLGAEAMFAELQGLLSEPKHLALFIAVHHLAVHWARTRNNSQ